MLYPAAEPFSCLPPGTGSNLSQWRNHVAIKFLKYYGAYNMCRGNKLEPNNIPPLANYELNCVQRAIIDCNVKTAAVIFMKLYVRVCKCKQIKIQ